jgi:hypothetical protein
LRPEKFEQAFAAMTNNCEPKPRQRNFIKLFIDGASGSGKTRFGWELYKELEVRQENLGLGQVFYAFVDAGGPPFSSLDLQPDPSVVAASVAQHLVAKNAINCSRVKLAPSVTLHDVASAMLAARSGSRRVRRGALVLHIDEFQKALPQVVELLKAIRMANEDGESNGLSVLVLPVCTGLWTDDERARDPSGEVVKVRHNYFQSVNDSWKLVQRSAAAFALGGQVIPLLRQESAPLQLRQLVEDTMGWPLACMHLGVEAMSVASHWLPGMNSAVLLEHIEQRTFLALNAHYDRTLHTAESALAQAGLYKLLAMALSCLKVSEHGKEDATRLEL